MEVGTLVSGVDISACEKMCKHGGCIREECEIYKALKVAQKDEYIKRLEKGYQTILDTISPYLSDFDGIDENGYFNIILAIKELLKKSKINQKQDSIAEELFK